MNLARPVGGVEAGGTKFVCAVGTAPDDVRAETTIRTTTPAETLARASEFFRAHRPLAAIGIAAFGPLDLVRSSPTFGWITNTPKPGWANTDLVGAFARSFDVPVAIDTDVNIAALGEHRWGAARGLDTFIYMTIGTGIGGGGFVNGRLMHGLVHPEMGHVLIPHDRVADPFPGVCPFHRDCLEGLASAVALRERWGVDPAALAATHRAWDLEAHYLALGLATIVSVISPERIVVGGGIARQPRVLPLVREKLRALLGGYVRSRVIEAEIESYVVAPGLGERAGLLGALVTAQEAIRESGCPERM